MVANGGNLEKAVRESGYSSAYARSGKITKTRAWNDFVEDYFNDDSILKTHKSLLKAKKTVRTRDGDIVDYESDFTIQLKALDMVYKLKGKYKPTQVTITNPYDSWSDEDLDREIKRIEKELRKF